MEIITNQTHNAMVVPANEVVQESEGNFIEANTNKVSINHLKNDCTIPVFAKDNVSTVSHYQFINKTYEIVKGLFPTTTPKVPDIRVSHTIKGRTPSAIGKPAKELLAHEKTLYYERCAFLIDIPQVTQTINGNEITLSVGGVRAYNQENLYSKKSLEKFKVFIGFKNMVCTNMCISTDGFSNEVRIFSITELEEQITRLFSSYNQESHLEIMNQMPQYRLSEKQFAHFIGKCRMYQHINKQEKKEIFPIEFNDGQLNTVVKNYYNDENFHREQNGNINLWNLYNLFTEANKSSYIDSNLERNVNAYELIQNLGNSIQNGSYNWFLSN